MQWFGDRFFATGVWDAACHGEHRLANRVVRRDKETRKLFTRPSKETKKKAQP